MAELTAAVLALVMVLVFVTLVGHGIWVAVSKLLGGGVESGSSILASRTEPRPMRRTCPRCFASLEIGQQACALCGWPKASVPTTDGASALRALRRQLDDFAWRGVIDAELRMRLVAAVEAEEQRLAQQAIPAAPTGAVVPPQLAAGGAQAEGEIVDIALEPIKPAAGMAAAQETAARPSVPVGERARKYAASRETAAAEALTGSTAAHVEPPPRREALSRLLATFMEEKNIRWGELVGGLLIVGCSIALVISFWSEIATRPLLKFGLFNGVTAALFGIGIYTDRRWKIHTTSHGVLVIATLLVPLNFLAIAAFTQTSPPTDVLSLAGEAASLIVFALLVYFAGRVLVLHEAWLLVVAVMLPSLMQLLVRRFAEPATPLVGLYALAAVPLASYLGPTLRVVRQRWSRDSIAALAEAEANRLLVFLGLASAAAAVPLALLLYNVPPARVTLHWLSPLVAVFGLPALLMGLLFWVRRGWGRGAAEPPRARHAGGERAFDPGHPVDSSVAGVALETAGISVGVAGALVMAAAVVLAWPDPATLLPTALATAAVFWGVAIWFGIPAGHVPAGLTFAVAWLIGFYAIRGEVGWRLATGARMEDVLLSVTSGQALLPLVVLLAAVAAGLRRLERREAALMYGIVMAGVAAASLALVMWYGFAQVGDPQNVTWTLAIYALVAVGAAILLDRGEIALIGSALLLATLVQAIVYRYAWRADPEQPWNVWITALLAHATLGAVVGAAAGWWSRGRWAKAVQTLIFTVHVAAVAAVALIVVSVANASAAALSMNLGWLAAAWMLLAAISSSPRLFTVSQAALVLAMFCGVTAALEARHWYIESRHPWLDPWFLQAQGIALAGYCLVIGALREFVFRAGRQRAQYVIEPPTPRWQAQFAHLVEPPWPAVDHVVEVLLVVLLVLAAMYAAAPGAAQELSPTAAATGTIREAPPIEQFELAGIPHRHAAGEGAWMLLVAVGLTLAGRLQQGETRWRMLGLVIVAMAACPLLAAWWAPQVAVASALRWLTAGAFALLSIPLWLRKTPNHAEVRDVLVALVAGVYVLLGVYVCQAALMGSGASPTVHALWPAVAVVTIAGICVTVVLAFVAQRQSTADRASSWMPHARDVVLLLAIAPAAILLMFALARSLDVRPIVGPEPGSWFRRVGFDVSYGVPLAVIALVLVGHAVRDRSSRFAFSAGLLFKVVATVVVLLRLARGDGVLDATAWITVAQVNAIVAGLVALIWLAAITWHRTRTASAKPQAVGGAGWPLLVTQVALAATLCGVFLAPAALNLAIDRPPAEWAVAADGALGWWAIALATAVAVWLNGRRGASINSTALLLAGLVALVSLTVAHWDNGRWQAFHTLLTSLCAAAWLTPFIARAADRLIAGRHEPSAPLIWSAPAVRLFAAAAVALAFYGYADDPYSPWWTIGALAAIGARNLWIAWQEARRGFVWIAAMLLVPAVSILWLDWGEQYSATTGFAQVMEFLWINVLALAALAVYSVCVERLRMRSRSHEAYRRPGIGFHRFAAWTIVVTLTFTTGIGLSADLSNNPISVSLALAWSAWLAAAVTAGACLWDTRIRWPVACLYCAGLVAVGLYLDGLDLRAPMFQWALANALAAYALATSGLWSMRERLRIALARWKVPVWTGAKSPAAEWGEGAGQGWLVTANLLIGVGVLPLVAWVELVMMSFTQRMVGAYAVGAQAFAIGLLARGAVRTPLQYLALVWGVFFAVAFGWAWLPPDYPAPWLHRLVVTVAALAVVILAYAFGLVKFWRENEWTRAAVRLVPSLSVIAAGLILLVMAIEVRAFMRDGSVPIAWPALIAVGIALVGLAIAALAAALLPGRDPLGLSERGRTAYVYVAEALAALVFLHIRVTMPWLFRGWFQQFWPLVVMGIAFVGVAFGEVFHRRRQRVLAEPLETTGALLPLLPAIGFWVISSNVDYSLLLLSIGILYAALAVLRQSFWYGVLAAVAANGSLWYLLSQQEGLSLWEHPQLWLIPPALCALAAGYIQRERLTAQQAGALRYAAAIVIYVSSTADIFINGVAEAPWLPAVLAGISILGVLAGIMLRVRAFLYLGTAFLMVALMTIIWHAAIHERQTWILWVAGIVTGVLIIALFGLFEKRRDDVLRVVEQLKHWQA